MAVTPAIRDIVEQIRNAIYGKDVRENIALGIEKCYEETSNIPTDVLTSHNIFDIVGFGAPASTTNNGITYTVNGREIHAQGTLTSGQANSHLEIYNGSMPIIMKPGDKYYARMYSTSGRVTFGVYFYNSDFSERLAAKWFSRDGVITVPSGASKLILWLLIESSSGSGPINETVRPELLSRLPADGLQNALSSNVLDVVGLGDLETRIHNGISYIVNGNKIRVQGSKTQSAENSHYEFYRGPIPSFMKPGDKYYAQYSSSSGSVMFGIYFYNSDWSERVSAYWPTKDAIIEVPESGINLILWLLVETTDPLNETVEPHLYSNYPDVKELAVEKSVKSYNVYDALYEYMYMAYRDKQIVDDKGIRFETSKDGAVYVHGTLNANNSTAKVEYYRGVLPDSFVPNSDMFVKMDSSSANVTLRIYFYDSDWESSTRVGFYLTSDSTIHVPAFAANLILWVGVEGNSGLTVNETVHPKILTQAVSQPIVNYNTFNYTVHNDSYAVTATPSITSVSDFYLAPTGTTADRTADIESLLQTNKVCRLGPGDYYITTGIDMPDGSSLIGSGRETRLILDPSVTEGYVISVGSYCIVQDLRVSGLVTGDLPYEEFTVGTRDGIVQLGDYVDFEHSATFSANYDKLSNLWIDNFTGSGIRSYRNDGAASFLANNIDIFHCGVGINIELFSEFHAWNNIRCRWCVYACIMNGGNNLFSNCHWDVCIHLLKIDNSLGNLLNDTHSSFTNCTFCHANNNQGNAIEIINVQNGVVFSNCQVFYSKIILTDAKGIVINGFNFGGGENIILTRCKGINISNCIFGTPPSVTKTDTTGLIWTNNMTRNGGIISAP